MGIEPRGGNWIFGPSVHHRALHTRDTRCYEGVPRPARFLSQMAYRMIRKDTSRMR